MFSIKSSLVHSEVAKFDDKTFPHVVKKLSHLKNKKDSFGRTPLQIAAMLGNIGATLTLLYEGVDPRSAASTKAFSLALQCSQYFAANILYYGGVQEPHDAKDFHPDKDIFLGMMGWAIDQEDQGKTKRLMQKMLQRVEFKPLRSDEESEKIHFVTIKNDLAVIVTLLKSKNWATDYITQHFPRESKDQGIDLEEQSNLFEKIFHEDVLRQIGEMNRKDKIFTMFLHGLFNPEAIPHYPCTQNIFNPIGLRNTLALQSAHTLKDMRTPAQIQIQRQIFQQEEKKLSVETLLPDFCRIVYDKTVADANENPDIRRFNQKLTGYLKTGGEEEKKPHVSLQDIPEEILRQIFEFMDYDLTDILSLSLTSIENYALLSDYHTCRNPVFYEIEKILAALQQELLTAVRKNLFKWGTLLAICLAGIVISGYESSEYYHKQEEILDQFATTLYNLTNLYGFVNSSYCSDFHEPDSIPCNTTTTIPDICAELCDQYEAFFGITVGSAFACAASGIMACTLALYLKHTFPIEPELSINSLPIKKFISPELDTEIAVVYHRIKSDNPVSFAHIALDRDTVTSNVESTLQRYKDSYPSSPGFFTRLPTSTDTTITVMNDVKEEKRRGHSARG